MLTTYSKIQTLGSSLGRLCKSLRNQDLRRPSRPSPRSTLPCFKVTESSQRSPKSSSSSLSDRYQKTRRGEPGQGPEENTEPEARAKESSYEGERDCVGRTERQKQRSTREPLMCVPVHGTRRLRAERWVHRPGNPGMASGCGRLGGGPEHTPPELLASAVSGQ